MQKKILLAGLMFLLLLVTGCLTTESKEYRYTVKPDGSGDGMITFINILSQDDDGRDVSFKDFGELVTDYLEGSSFEESNPNYTVTGKRLYEKNGKLNGEVTFTFKSIDSVGFFRTANCPCAPVLFSTSTLQETLSETNGLSLNESKNIPLISWDATAKEYTFKTKVLDDTSNTHSLLEDWTHWKDKK
jgi:hypothetical protein